MRQIITQFTRGFIFGESTRSDNATNLMSGNEYDALILASSWDARCLCLTESSQIRAELGVVLVFDTRDKKGLRERHDRILLEFARSISQQLVIVSGPSSDVRLIWDRLSAHLIGLRNRRRRGLRILMDLSACPRYFSLGVTALAFAGRIGCQMTLFYSEGFYVADSGSGEIAFTGGHWSTVPVPLLSGLYDAAKGRYYLVSIGFEGEKTLRAVSRADPDRISVLMPKPGVAAEYEARTASANKALVKEFLVPKTQIIDAPASDAIAAWRTLATSTICRPESENISYLCCGTKPHALALTLNAVVLGYPTVLYNIPEEHRVHETRPNGVFWRFDLKDLSAIDNR